VLVLDEATSSLDAANEAELTRTLDELSQGRTTITIAHRLSTVRDVDRIVVLERGQVTESGPPGELQAGTGAFSRLSRAGMGTP
jgi:ATP-binding cassette, subfamily C, bacterial CydD